MSAPVVRWIKPRLNDHARTEAFEVISTAERTRHDSLPEAQRDSFLAGRLALRRLAAELLDVAAAEVPLSATCPDCGGPHGKPVIADSDLHLSLSRTDGVIVVAANWDAPIGIDVEPAEPAGSTAENAAARAERLAAIGAVAGEPSIRHWTRVEAILKADGRGLRVDPREVVIDSIDGRLIGRIVGSPKSYAVEELILDRGVTVTVAVELPAA